MNAIPRFNIYKRVELIGEETLSRRPVVVRPNPQAGCDDLRLIGGTHTFNPMKDLADLLNTVPKYTQAQLASAEAAIRRIDQNPRVDVETWANELGRDLSEFED